MKSISTKLFILSLFTYGCLQAQSSYTNVMISNQSSPEEVSICINPRNTNQISAGANISSYYYSTDAGFNWTRGTLMSSYTVWGDPAITVDTAGNFYYFHLTNAALFIDRIVCQKSTNGGMTWSDGSYTGYNPPKQQDKAWGCVEWTNGARRGRNFLYVTWTQFDHYGSSNPADSSNILFSRSTDGGLTFSTALRIDRLAGDCIDADNTDEGAVPCVGPNAEIYVGWAGPLVFNSQFKIFFDKSTDRGNTWLSNDIVVADQIGGWDYNVSGIYRANGLPITCCDVSNGPYRGTIYINWTDGASGDHDVKLAKSTNGGLNWSAPIRVNDDPAGREQFFTWMTIDQVTGYIYIVFYDRRNYADNQTDVYMARSTNGGTTFINERISASPFVPTSGVFFGDYNNITAHNGKIRPMWTRLSSGALSVWTAIVDIPTGTEQSEKQIPSDFELSQNYPNPFNPGTVIRYQLSVNSFVTLKVYDMLGKEIATLVNQNLKAGSHEVRWDASAHSSGIYYCRMTAGDYTETKKMILTK